MWVKPGQVTIFMMLIFMVILSLLAAQYHSSIFYACRADAERAARLSAESFLAAYQRPLRDRYQILAVDGGFGGDTFQQERLEEYLLQVYEKNMESGLTKKNVEAIAMEEPIFTMLIDGDWDFFVREITLNRKAALVSDGLELLLGQWKKNNDRASEDLQQKRMTAENSATEENMGEEEIGREQQQVRDPRDTLMAIWNQGILAAACPENFHVSEKECVMTDVSYPEAGKRIQAAIDFKDGASIQNLFGKWDEILDMENSIRSVAEEAAVHMYIGEVFKNAVTDGDNGAQQESVLKYEMEYIIGGNETDMENMKNVLWKILAIRCVMNLSYILMSPEMNMQVMETAGLLSTALLLPQFTEVIGFLLKSAWAFTEALADCRTLLKGGKIPVIKTKDTWYLSWDQMFRLNASVLDGNRGEQGLDYSGYLHILLATTKPETKYRRMTHLMEKNIRLIDGYEDFRMKYCIYGIQARFNYDSHGFGSHDVQTALSY
ncbi:DUF5702 domain-containing protein [Frisingicoccus sp.]|uniref:DUF5702 domain-containing protein n=1 Tax=Frisingicoccus sp. TaxID=1918627 RepID=UPI002EA6A139|nr:DUF5702 domain-containing protein [Frisingicoccus sp.]